MTTIHETLTGPIAAELAGNGIHLVLSANTKSAGDAWSEATDLVRVAAPTERLALVHVVDGSWHGGQPRYRDTTGWVPVTKLNVHFPVADGATARLILGVLTRHGLAATWDGDPMNTVDINLDDPDAPATPANPVSAQLRCAYQYAESNRVHSHDAMIAGAAEIDRLTALVETLQQSLNDRVEAAYRFGDRVEAAIDEGHTAGQRTALQELHKTLMDLMTSGGTVKDYAQTTDDYFVEKGLGSVIYH